MVGNGCRLPWAEQRAEVRRRRRDGGGHARGEVCGRGRLVRQPSAADRGESGVALDDDDATAFEEGGDARGARAAGARARMCYNPSMIDKTCEVCGAAFSVQAYRANTARFCSQKCGGAWHAKTRLAAMPHTWAVGNRHRAGRRPTNAFPEGHSPWNRGVEGLRLSPATEFPVGHTPANKAPLGTVRERPDKGGALRAWVKIAEPNRWRLRAVCVWEAANGSVPHGFVVHHENRDTLDDRPENLSLVSRAEHLAEHRPEFESRRALAAAAARRGDHRDPSREKSGP
jgi:hypothetical protein